MVRTRMTALDIKASVDELRNAIVGLRLQNIYDLSPKVFLLKFAQGDKKVHVLIESGVRIHLTTLTREKPKMPSQFTLKLRKHVRSWRLDAIEQIGFDRAVDFRFGTGEGSHHFVVEFFAKGNFVLTDHNYQIMMLLRTHKDGGVDCRVKETYSFHNKASRFQPATTASVTKCLQEAKPNDKLVTALFDCGGYGTTIIEHVLHSVAMNPKEQKKNGTWEDRLETMVPILVAGFTACNSWFTSPFRQGGFLVAAAPPQGDSSPAGAPADNPSAADLSSNNAGGASSPQLLSSAVGGGMGQSTRSFDGSSFTGSCALTLARSGRGGALETQNFLDFSPVSLKQYDSTAYTVLPAQYFGNAAERFFLPTEQDRIEAHNVKKETATMSTRDKCLRDHQKRIDKLLSQEELNRKKGQLLQFNFEEVDEAMDLIRMALASKISWSDLNSVLKARQREGHPVANIIHELNLDRNSITVLLCDPDFSDGYFNEDGYDDDEFAEEEGEYDDDEDGDYDDDDEEEETLEDLMMEDDEEAESKSTSTSGKKKGKRKGGKKKREAVDESQVVPVAVEVDLSMNAWTNAGRYFDSKKASSRKLEKTIAATDKAVAGAERKGSKNADRKGPAKKDITVTRVPMWFEKFYWFLTSFGHIVVAARDPAQADVMVKRYMKPGDFFVHSEADGCLPCLVKNPKKIPIALGSLEEAGTMAICRSKAWESKMSVSAWWVHAVQVSKTLPGASSNSAGSYLTSGRFHIRGKKNFLPAMPLQLGCALLFRSDQEHSGIASHVATTVADSNDGAAMEYIPCEVTELAPSATGGSGGPNTPAATPTPSSATSTGGAGKFPSTSAAGGALAQYAASSLRNSSEDGGGMGDRLGSNDMSDEALSAFAGGSTGSGASGASGANKKAAAKNRRLAALRPKSNTPASSGTSPAPSTGGAVLVHGEGAPPSEGSSDITATSFPSQPPLPELKDDDSEMPLSSSHDQQQEEEGGDGSGDSIEDEANDADASSAATSKKNAQGKGKSGGEPGNKPSKPGLGMPKSKRQMNKLKKIQKKYGEQDEDDREAAMALLGNKLSQVHKYDPTAPSSSSVARPVSALKGGKKGSSASPIPSAGEESSSPVDGGVTPTAADSEGISDGGAASSGSKRPQSGSQKVRFAPPSLPEGESGGLDFGAGGSTSSPTASSGLLPVADQDHDALRRKKAEAEEEEARIAEKIVVELDSEVPHLTGKLDEEEIPGYCYAIVAPYAALLSYSYKVKLTPGHEKRGHAAKTAVHSITQQAQQLSPSSVVAPFVQQVIQRLPLEEVTQQFAANVKVHVPETGAAGKTSTSGAKDSKKSGGEKSNAKKQQAAAAAVAAAGGASSSGGSKSEKKKQSQLFKDAMMGLAA